MVGNGKNFDIWKDHWVLGMLSRHIETNRGQVLLQTMDELIDPATGVSWDGALSRDIYV
jgi:hypothetical protein